MQFCFFFLIKIFYCLQLIFLFFFCIVQYVSWADESVSCAAGGDEFRQQHMDVFMWMYADDAGTWCEMVQKQIDFRLLTCVISNKKSSACLCLILDSLCRQKSFAGV